MFRQIFLFECKYRLKRPAVYLCFAAALLFSFFSFATGNLPVADKEMINSPSVIAFFIAVTSMMMMLITSGIMGVPLYRDIEHNTKEYYLSYPITRSGYFWGRFFGSFFFVMLIAAAVPFGAWLGGLFGRTTGWTPASRYGSEHLLYYLHPYLTIALPNLVFTSGLFFGLVAATRNVKVIYSSGIALFLGYIFSNFFLHGTRDLTVINLSDPFGIVPIRMETNGYTVTQQNSSLVSIHGSFLLNRFLWPGLGLIILGVVYARFSFERFFSGGGGRGATRREGRSQQSGTKNQPAPTDRSPIPSVQTRFTDNYNRQTLFTLTRIELLNILRDNYFWLILSCGTIFVGFIFWHASQHYWVPDLPRTVLLLSMFNENFLFFIFIILIFYTGETIHREKVTRFATINDALPPPNWVLSTAKLFSLLGLATILALLPVLLGLITQLVKGFTQVNFPIYLTNLFVIDLPWFVAMLLFAFMIHTVINNKFAANGIGIVIWVLLFLLIDSGKLDYFLMLYSYTPSARLSDMDGLGHMTGPVLWFRLYWLFLGGLFLVVAALFFNRGVLASFRERWQLAKERWGRKTRVTALILLVGFLATGSYIYYNVSVLNNYLTHAENTERAAIFEQQLKHYEKLPLPKPVKIRITADLFPDQRKAVVKAFVTLENKSSTPIDSLLLDGDNISEYSLKVDGLPLSYTRPLIYHRGKFNLFRSRLDTAEYRLYRLPRVLAPGERIEIEVNSVVAHEGFTNNVEDPAYLHNALFFTGGLPGLGYDAGDELREHDDRIKYHLPEKKNDPLPHGDPAGIGQLLNGSPTDLYTFDLTVSTAGDQTAIAPGALLGRWSTGGRNYFHYVEDQPGMYFRFGVLSAKYAVLADSVRDGGAGPQSVTGAPGSGQRTIPIRIYFYPDHRANLDRFMAACKDGLSYYSLAYGPYPGARLSVMESSTYAPDVFLMPGLIAYSENFGWNAGFTDPNEFDYCYFMTGYALAWQWWNQRVAANNTIGAQVISDGLPAYGVLMLEERRWGKDNIKRFLQYELDGYSWGRGNAHRRNESTKEKPLLDADQGYIWNNKAAIVLYGLRDLIGEDSMNVALREFSREFAFRANPPFAGSDDLYRILRRHVPDSLQYYLRDSWEKVTFYENKMLEATAVPLPQTTKNRGSDDGLNNDLNDGLNNGQNNDLYKVTLKFSVGKIVADSLGEVHSTSGVNDYIDIGVFGAPTKTREGRTLTQPLFLKKYRLTAGEHSIELIVRGKPVNAGIDPYGKLVDLQPWDIQKAVEIAKPGIPTTHPEK